MIAAQRCFYVVRCLKPSALVTYAVAFVLLGVFILVVLPDASWYWIGAIFSGALAGGILMPLAVVRWYIPRLGRRIIRQQRGLHREIVMEWDSEELRGSSDKGHSRTAFAEYTRFAENRDIILLYHSDTLFEFVPKRVLDIAQIENLRMIARRENLKGARRS